MASFVTSSPVTVTCQGILFDMDGILISSLGSVERSWTKWSEMRGVDPAYAISVIHGRRAVDSLSALRPDLDPQEELKILEDFEVEDSGDIQILPGVPGLMKALPQDRWTVVTSATDRLTRVRLAAAGILVPDHLITAESVTEGKPNPAPYLAGARLLGFDPSVCVVFEDSASGVKAGRAAGCVVLATTFSHPPEDLGPAHYLISDLTGLTVTQSADGALQLHFQPLDR